MRILHTDRFPNVFCTCQQQTHIPCQNLVRSVTLGLEEEELPSQQESLLRDSVLIAGSACLRSGHSPCILSPLRLRMAFVPVLVLTAPDFGDSPSPPLLDASRSSARRLLCRILRLRNGGVLLVVAPPSFGVSSVLLLSTCCCWWWWCPRWTCGWHWYVSLWGWCWGTILPALSFGTQNLVKSLPENSLGALHAEDRWPAAAAWRRRVSLLSTWLALHDLLDMGSEGFSDPDSEVEMSSRKSNAATASCSGLPKWMKNLEKSSAGRGFCKAIRTTSNLPEKVKFKFISKNEM